MFCAIMELSNVLHPGSYEPKNTMKELERLILIEARKHTRMIISWFRESYTVVTLTGQLHEDIFEVILWKMVMTLASSMDQNKHCFKPIIEECTPDAVSCIMYDTLIDGQFSGPWERRHDFITDTFDLEWAPMTIEKNTAVKFTAVEEDGMTKHDAFVMENNHMGLPSTNNRVDMKMWLDNSKKRMMEEENSQPTGKQSVLSFNIYLKFKSTSGMKSKKRRS